MRLFLVAVCLFACLNGAAYATSILVVNHSFETLPADGLPFGGCGAGCQYSAEPIPGWVNAGGSGQFQPGNPANNFYFDTLDDGPTSAYSNGGTVSQTVGATVLAGVTYTLLVDIGDRKDTAGAGTAALVVNGNVSNATGLLVDGGWSAWTAIYTGTPADAGSAITIVLNSGGVQGNWDNVRLSDNTAVPEPGTLALFGLTAVVAGRRRLRKSR